MTQKVAALPFRPPELMVTKPSPEVVPLPAFTTTPATSHRPFTVAPPTLPAPSLTWIVASYCGF